MRFIIFWGASLVVLPFFVRFDNPINFVGCKDIFFVTLLFVSLLLFGLREKISWKLTIPAILLVLSAFSNQYSTYSANVIWQWLMICSGILFIFHFASNFNGDHQDVLLNFLFIAGLAQSIFCIVNYLGYDPYKILTDIILPGKYIKVSDDETHRIMNSAMTKADGSMGNPMISASIVAISFCSLARKKLWVFAPIYMAAIYFCHSTMAGLTVLVFIGYYGFKKIKKHKYLLVATLLAISIILLMNKEDLHSANGRVPIWKQTILWSDTWDTVLFGYGPGHFPDMFSKDFTIIKKGQELKILYLQAHNEYVEAYTIFGIFGLLILIPAIIYPLVGTKNHIIKAAYISALVNMVSNFTLHTIASGMIVLICYAILVSEKMRTRLSSNIHGGNSYVNNSNKID